MLLSLISRLDGLESKLTQLENKLVQIEKKELLDLRAVRGQLVQILDKREVPRTAILRGYAYRDLTPKEVHELLHSNLADLMVLDVADERNSHQLGDICIHIPFEELKERYKEISKNKTIIVISKRGVRSILACKFLVEKGYLNVNNASGGHKFWISSDS